MADIVVDPPAPAPRLTRLQRTRVLEHYMFSTTAGLFAAIVFAGFARTYYLHGVVAAPLPSWIVHVHGLLMTLWVALFVVQAALVSAKQIRIHQRLGYAAIGLAVMIGV